MVIFKKVKDLKKYLKQEVEQAKQVAFIPTMGALHAGHISLIKEAQEKHKSISVCSIFLNPTQFNNTNDYLKYPNTIDNDIELLLKANCDILFLPPVEEVYPEGPENAKAFEFGILENILEGAMRPGHFKGVGQVVSILLDIVEPNLLLMGLKDFQQCLVVQELIKLKKLANNDKNYIQNLKLITCPTIREQDGLAMSSRNRRLTEPQRIVASTIYQCMVAIQAKKSIENFARVKKECWDILIAKGFSPDYIALADVKDLRELVDYEANTSMIILIAAKIGEIRLIDNLII